MIEIVNLTRRDPDWLLFISTILLLVIGVMMVYSSSGQLALHAHGDSFYFAKKQLLFAALGIAAMLFVSKVNPQFLYNNALFFLLCCFALLVIVIIPGVGVVRNGARSWLGIGAFSIQPSEFTKLALILFLARLLSAPSYNISSLKHGFIPVLGLVAGIFGIIMLQPDLGTGMVLVGTCVVMIFVAGARYKHLLWCLAMGLVCFAMLVLIAPYRIQRLVAFIYPWDDPLGAGYQIIQSLYAMGPGGLLGLGFGMSRQKFLYLPEPHTDFIYSIISEELGFLGAGIVLILFAILAWRGLLVALTAPNMFQSLVAVGVTSMIMIQGLLNIGVVSGAFPVTGVTLPFLSYGGSSLILILVAVGILLNLSRYRKV